MDSSLFPAWPLVFGDSVLFGVLVLVGMLAGEFAARMRLPRVSGYLLAGVLLGLITPAFSVQSLFDDARIFVDVALGLVMFDLGRRLDWEWLRRDRSLAVAGIAEVLLSFGAMFIVLRWFNYAPLEAGIAAAIGISTSPAVGLLVARDAHAEGQVTERSLTLAALNTLIAVFVVTILLAGAHYEYRGHLLRVLLHTGYLFAGSVALGLIGARAVVACGRLLGKREQAQFALIIALLLLTVGLAHTLKLSVLLALLVFGVASRRFDHKRDLVEVEWGHAAHLFYVILFVVIGASLSWSAFVHAGGIALLYVLARMLGKMLGLFAVAPFSALRWRQNVWLAATLTPMSAIAIVLLHDAGVLFPELAARLTDVLLAAIAYLEIIGPLLVLFALRRSGEIPKEQ